MRHFSARSAAQGSDQVWGHAARPVPSELRELVPGSPAWGSGAAARPPTLPPPAPPERGEVLPAGEPRELHQRLPLFSTGGLYRHRVTAGVGRAP